MRTKTCCCVCDACAGTSATWNAFGISKSAYVRLRKQELKTSQDLWSGSGVEERKKAFLYLKQNERDSWCTKVASNVLKKILDFPLKEQETALLLQLVCYVTFLLSSLPFKADFLKVCLQCKRKTLWLHAFKKGRLSIQKQCVVKCRSWWSVQLAARSKGVVEGAWVLDTQSPKFKPWFCPYMSTNLNKDTLLKLSELPFFTYKMR